MTQKESSKRLTLIELNEFSVALLRQGTEEFALPNVARMLQLRAGITTTDDMIEHRGLDPWVQWVSVHAGVPSSMHGVIHLGDAPANLEFTQIWETLSEKGITSGVWGAMNATRNCADNCLFFLPDPWTFSEKAYPEKLNELLALPRYYSKNYLEVSRQEFFKGALKLLKFILGSGAVMKIIAQTPMVIKGILRNGLNNAVLFSLFDLFSAILFVKYKKRFRPKFSLIFLNSIAHLQHHGWHSDKKISGNMAFGLRVIDRVLGILFDSLDVGEACVIMNALTQKNIVNEKPRICYRQINPHRFLQAVHFRFENVEQLMTNDAHVFFATAQECDYVASELERVTINGVPLFHVDRGTGNSRKLFYQVDFWDKITDDVEIIVNGRKVSYLEHFEAIVARTGAHLRDGNVFYSGIELPRQLYNHEVSGSIISFFGDCSLPNANERAPLNTAITHAA